MSTLLDSLLPASSRAQAYQADGYSVLSSGGVVLDIQPLHQLPHETAAMFAGRIAAQGDRLYQLQHAEFLRTRGQS